MSEVTYHPDAKGIFTDLDNMYVERGTKADWDALHHLHYKNEGSVVGAKYYRLMLGDDLIGVTAISLPRPLLKERHKAFPKLKPGNDTRLINTWRYKWINEHICVVGRIVLDTRYRGVGASYRFQNIVARMTGKKIVEIQSSMSKYNLFAQKAGFKFIKPMRANVFQKGIKFFRQTFASHPADTEGLIQEVEKLPKGVKERVIKQTRDFYFQNSALEKTGSNRDKGTTKVDALDFPTLIKRLQQLVLASPMYGFYMNPDYGRQLPERIYLHEFDNQKMEEPLKNGLL